MNKTGFINYFDEYDRGAIVDFDDYATLLQELTYSKEDLIKVLSKINESGGTSVFNGLLFSIVHLRSYSNLMLSNFDYDFDKTPPTSTFNVNEKEDGENGVEGFESYDYDDIINMLTNNISLINNQVDTNNRKYIVLLTDGKDTYTNNYWPAIKIAQDLGITIFMIGLGNDVDSSLLMTVASATNGKYVNASSTDELKEIYASILNDVTDFSLDSDGDGISDYYETEISRGNLRLGDGSTVYDNMNSLIGLNPNSKDSDGDGIVDGEELYVTSIEISTDDGNVISTVYARMYSNPTMMDTDGDGHIDSEDERPLIWDVSDRDLAILSQSSYGNLGYVDSFSNYPTPDWWFLNDEVASLSEMQGWIQVDSMSEPDNGFFGALYQKDDNLVFSFRGTDNDFWDIVENFGIFFGDYSSNQQVSAVRFVNKMLSEIDINQKTKIYLTGHSLGGYLALRTGALILINDEYKSNIEKISTFNSPNIPIYDLTSISGTFLKLIEIFSLSSNSELVFNHNVYEYGSSLLDEDEHALSIFNMLNDYGFTIGKVIEYNYKLAEKTQLYVFQEKLLNISKPHLMCSFFEDGKLDLISRF